MNIAALVGVISFPILERIPLFGDVAISPHGLGIAIGFGLGAIMMVRRAEKRGLGHLYVPNISEAVQELLTRAAVGAILGARFFYVLTHLDQFEGEWIRVLYAWEGGLTFLGGVTGAVLLSIPFARKRNWRMTMLLDSAAPGIALGLAVGRVGDLLIGDHIGAPTNFALAWRCTGNYWTRATNSFGQIAPLPYPTGGAAPTAGCFDVAVHHTALYDFGAAVIVLVVLLLMERRRWFDGAFIAAWVGVYGVLRITSDFARNDRTWAGLTGSQWSLVGAIVAVAAVLLLRRPWQRSDWAWDRVFVHPWHNPNFGATPSEAQEAGAARTDMPPAAPFPALFGTSPTTESSDESPDDSPDDAPSPDRQAASADDSSPPAPAPPRVGIWGEPLADPVQDAEPLPPIPQPREAMAWDDEMRPRPIDPEAPPRMARRKGHRGSDA